MKTSLLQILGTISIGACYLCLTGCEKSVHSHDKASATAPATTPEPAVAVHNHPSEGPRGGSLVELGEEEYHAELIHDETSDTIAFFMLDSTAKLAVPIEATEVHVNLSHDGQAEQFALAAYSQQSDPAGRSSAFTLSNAELASDLDNEAIKAQLVVTIAGKQYRGTINHSHKGHEAHGHEGDHDEDHTEHAHEGDNDGDHEEGHDECAHERNFDGDHEEDHDDNDQEGEHDE